LSSYVGSAIFLTGMVEGGIGIEILGEGREGRMGTNMFLYCDQNHIIFSCCSSEDLRLQLLRISRLKGLDDRHLAESEKTNGTTGGRIGDHVGLSQLGACYCPGRLRFAVLICLYGA